MACMRLRVLIVLACAVVGLAAAAETPRSPFDAAAAGLLPELRDYGKAAAAGAPYSGRGFARQELVLPGNVPVPKDAELLIFDGALLVRAAGSEAYELIPYFSYPAVKPTEGAIVPEELDVENFRQEILGESRLQSPGVRFHPQLKIGPDPLRPINEIVLELAGGRDRLEVISAEEVCGALRRVLESFAFQDVDLTPLAREPRMAELMGTIRRVTKGTSLTWFDRGINKTILVTLYPKTFTPPTWRPGYFYRFPAPLSAAALPAASAKVPTADELTSLALAELYARLRRTDPAVAGADQDERRRTLAVIETLAGRLPVDEWNRYRNTPDVSLEKKYPILAYLRLLEQSVLEDIKNTRVRGGVKIWKLYNMGMVVKTAEKCFAVDLIPLRADFSSVLDFAVQSHWHGDHVDKRFYEGMVRKGKPFYATKYPWNSTAPKGLTYLEKDTVLLIGPLTVSLKLSAQGDPGEWSHLPCLITTVDCGPASGDFRLVHTGDSSHAEDMPRDRDADFLTMHMDVGMDQRRAISIARAKRVNLDHVLELAHEGRAGAYSKAYARAAELELADGPTVLGWGESLVFENKQQKVR